MTRILNTNYVTLDVQATNRAEVIKKLANLLKRDGAIDCQEVFIKDVWQCETGGSTSFENHTAIPHDKPSVVINATLAISRTCQGIPWETLDGSNVRCIISLAVRLEGQSTTHIRLLSQVAGVLVDDDIIE